jgi:flavin reductase (DIM6/NTAB) family NADH-FMN oxidoreductase RutF
MDKIKIGSKVPVYPMPTTLVGANVEGKPNFLTIVWCSIVNFKPPFIAVTLHKDHYTNKGINENKTFSVNIPSVDNVKITDYCSVVSGYDEDKSKLFKIFYGSLKTAPMISEFPLCSECKLVQKIELATHEIFVGEIVETYTEKQYLTHELPDIEKINPIIFSLYDNKYWRIGEHIGYAMHIGKEYQDIR